MYATETLMNPSPERPLPITQEEADALMSVLLNTPPSEEVPEAVTTRLLCRVAEVQRAFTRNGAEKPMLCPPSTLRGKVIRRRPMRSRRQRFSG